MLIMLKSDLHPPYDGPAADPMLYGIAAALAELFPPVMGYADFPADAENRVEGDADRARGDRD